MKYAIDGVEIELDTPGEAVAGEGGVLLRQDDDLAAGTGWHDAGYTVSTFLRPALREVLWSGLAKRVRQAVADVHAVPEDVFSLPDYHHVCGDDDAHTAVTRRLQWLSSLDNFPIDYREVDDWVSGLIGKAVSCQVPGREASGRFFVRIVRPGKLADNNPPHRDVWLPRLRDAINLYAPLAGSNDRSSLSLIPGSHFWPESDLCRTVSGARVNGRTFTVPAVVDVRHGMVMTRPTVADHEAMLFSPYLVHGGAVNLNADITRMSLEMRFWRRQ